MEHLRGKCYLLSGLSGAGKSTAGRLLAASLPNCAFVDGDTCYRTKDAMPRVTLSSGERTSNWDDAGSIDWARLGQIVAKALEASDVVLATFLPRTDLMTFPVVRHVRLSSGAAGDAVRRCIEARHASKGLAEPSKQKRDELMVREVVYPAFVETARLFPADAVVEAFAEDGSRETLEHLVAELRGAFILRAMGP